MMRMRDIAITLAVLIVGAASAEAQERRGAWSTRAIAPANRVQVEQIGGPHWAGAAQSGASNLISTVQQGRSHAAAIVQTGDGNTALIRQYGQNNAASITQTGSGNTACVFQVGRNMGAAVEQSGGHSVGVIQTPRGSREVPVEICSSVRLGRGGALVGDGARTGRGVW